jgi:hypothetical protein
VGLRSTQRLTETSIRNLPGVGVQPARKANILIGICLPITEDSMLNKIVGVTIVVVVC